MKKSIVNYWLDIIAFILFAFLTSTGILIEYSLPERSGRSEILGLTRHSWGDVHFYIAIGLFVTLALHIVLHWKWLLNLTLGRAGTASGWRFLLGIAALIVVILMAAAPVVSPVDVVDQPRGGHGFNRQP